MENFQAIYINTFAEGATVTEPEQISDSELPIMAKTWKRSLAVAHYRLIGTETVSWKGTKKQFLIGHIGSAKTMLPVEEEFSGLDKRNHPERLLNYWISAVIDDFDLQDEAQPILILNRAKALKRLQEINARRVVQGGQAYAVVQAENRGAYILNVAGFPAAMPRAFYDWDSAKTPEIGEGFNVSVMASSQNGLLVSRRELLTNPFDAVSNAFHRGARIKAKVTHIYRGVFKGEILPGVRISMSSRTMYHRVKVGDVVTVEVIGKNAREFYGVVV